MTPEGDPKSPTQMAGGLQTPGAMTTVLLFGALPSNQEKVGWERMALGVPTPRPHRPQGPGSTTCH